MVLTPGPMADQAVHLLETLMATPTESESSDVRSHPRGGRPRRALPLAKGGKIVAEGQSVRSVARQLGVPVPTLHRALRGANRRREPKRPARTVDPNK